MRRIAKRRTAKDDAVLKDYRNRFEDEATISIAASNAIKTGIGNCRETVCICYQSLSCNPRFIGNSEVVMCIFDTIDHAFLMIIDKINPFYFCPNPMKKHHISDFNDTTIIVDPWTRDWYFPNLDYYIAFDLKLVGNPNKWQIKIRNQCMKNPFRKWILPT